MVLHTSRLAFAPIFIMLYLSCLQTNTRPVKGPALPEQLVSPPDNPVCSVPFKFQEVHELDATIGYIELGVPPGPPPHKTHYAIPFDINDDTDQGRHHPKTVSRVLVLSSA